MNPIAFTIFGKDIHYYGIFIALGFLAATGIMLWKRKRAGMTKDQVFDLAMLALFTGILGARALHVIEKWKEHRGIMWIFRIDEGGLVFYGGFILAITCVMIYARRKKISVPALLDVTAPGIAIAHAFGRLGCYLQGCCFGKTAWDSSCAIRFPLDPKPGRFPQKMWCPDGFTVPVYPTQLWESGANVLLCVLLLCICRKFPRAGQIAGIYLILYAIARFSLEFFRGDNPKLLLGLTISQAIALFLMIPAGALLLIFAKDRPELEHA